MAHGAQSARTQAKHLPPAAKLAKHTYAPHARQQLIGGIFVRIPTGCGGGCRTDFDGPAPGQPRPILPRDRIGFCVPSPPSDLIDKRLYFDTTSFIEITLIKAKPVWMRQRQYGDFQPWETRHGWQFSDCWYALDKMAHRPVQLVGSLVFHCRRFLTIWTAFRALDWSISANRVARSSAPPTTMPFRH